jgi:hypothetical protein
VVGRAQQLDDAVVAEVGFGGLGRRARAHAEVKRCTIRVSDKFLHVAAARAVFDAPCGVSIVQFSGS